MQMGNGLPPLTPTPVLLGGVWTRAICDSAQMCAQEDILVAYIFFFLRETRNRGCLRLKEKNSTLAFC